MQLDRSIGSLFCEELWILGTLFQARPSANQSPSRFRFQQFAQQVIVVFVALLDFMEEGLGTSESLAEQFKSVGDPADVCRTRMLKKHGTIDRIAEIGKI